MLARPRNGRRTGEIRENGFSFPVTPPSDEPDQRIFTSWPSVRSSCTSEPVANSDDDNAAEYADDGRLRTLQAQAPRRVCTASMTPLLAHDTQPLRAAHKARSAATQQTTTLLQRTHLHAAGPRAPPPPLLRADYSKSKLSSRSTSLALVTNPALDLAPAKSSSGEASPLPSTSIDLEPQSQGVFATCGWGFKPPGMSLRLHDPSKPREPSLELAGAPGTDDEDGQDTPTATGGAASSFAEPQSGSPSPSGAGEGKSPRDRSLLGVAGGAGPSFRDLSAGAASPDGTGPAAAAAAVEALTLGLLGLDVGVATDRKGMCMCEWIGGGGALRLMPPCTMRSCVRARMYASRGTCMTPACQPHPCGCGHGAGA